MPSKCLSSSPALVAFIGILPISGCASSDGSKGALAAAGSAAASAGSAGSTGTPASGGTTATAGTGATNGGSSGSSLTTAGASGAGAAGEGTVATGGSAGASVGGASGRAGATSSGGSSAAGGSGGTDASGTVPTSDPFDGTTLNSSWTVFRPDLADITIADGSLSIVPHSGALWYQASQADLAYKLVTGDFKATSTVHARKASNRMQTPAQFADVGGIMARNPSGSSENYILGVVGYAEMNQLAVEHKSTTNGKSVYGEVAFTPDAEFRMCREGSKFTIYYRHPGDTTWGPAFDPFVRPDLPATVQVGAIAYTGANAPDFVAIFDNFTFEPLGAGCEQ
ncbi:MAG TPA: hypothetical protein VER96_39210 [Polyangiaceae bacterium]|nr:hypothetical protein [Polyangiaceae bacterium]